MSPRRSRPCAPTRHYSIKNQAQDSLQAKKIPKAKFRTTDTTHSYSSQMDRRWALFVRIQPRIQTNKSTCWTVGWALTKSTPKTNVDTWISVRATSDSKASSLSAEVQIIDSRLIKTLPTSVVCKGGLESPHTQTLVTQAAQSAILATARDTNSYNFAHLLSCGFFQPIPKFSVSGIDSGSF